MMTKPIKASSVCHGKRHAVRKNKIEGKKLPTACKSMNISNTLATMGKLSASRAVYGRVLGAVTQSPNTKNYTKYDQDFKQSRKLHFDTCKKHQSVCLQSIENRKFTSTDKEDFEALLGKGKYYADHMPASDLQLRNKMVKLLIDELSGLLNRAVNGRVKVVLSRICAGPSARLGHLAFEGQGAFPSQCGMSAAWVIEAVCGCPFQCKKFFRLLGTSDQCRRVSGLYMQLSHAAGLYGVRGLGPNR